MNRFISTIKSSSKHIPFKLPILSGVGRGLWWQNNNQTLNAYWLGTYEKTVQAALKQQLQHGSVFWDIGAQSGFFSLIASRLVGNTGRVYSLEAMPENFDTIQLQRKINHCDNWEVIHAALWNHSRGITMDVRGAFTSMVQDVSEKPSHDSLDIDSIDIPALLKIWPAPDLIKMDIEGAEAAVFQNLPDHTLPSHTAFILEIHGESAQSTLITYAQKHSLFWADMHFNPIASPPLWGQCLLLPEKS